MPSFVDIRPAEAGDHAEWLRMRLALWPECPAEEHLCDISNIMSRLADLAVFVAVRPSGSLAGFIEVSIKGTAEGCERGPVGCVEGWYVDPDVRREGIGRKLLSAAEAWSLDRGCCMMASDARPDNAVSILVHKASGFEEVERLVHFRKPLLPAGRGVVSEGEGICGRAETRSGKPIGSFAPKGAKRQVWDSTWRADGGVAPKSAKRQADRRRLRGAKN